MSKNTRRNLFIIAAVAFFACATPFTIDVALGQMPPNPTESIKYVRFIRDGNVRVARVVIPNSLWLAEREPWNGRYTVHGIRCFFTGQMVPQRIENAVINLTFSCGTSTCGACGACDPNLHGTGDVTAAEINAYWDARMSGATRIGEPTWARNCHGHATGLGYWINERGMRMLLGLDWRRLTPIDNEVGVDYVRSPAGDHSERITGVYTHVTGVTVITESTEKMAYAGTYRFVYLLPGGAAWGWWDI